MTVYIVYDKCEYGSYNDDHTNLAKVTNQNSLTVSAVVSCHTYIIYLELKKTLIELLRVRYIELIVISFAIILLCSVKFRQKVLAKMTESQLDFCSKREPVTFLHRFQV